MVPFRTILVPLDGSPLAEKALPPALRLGVAEDSLFGPLIFPVSYTHLDVYKRQPAGGAAREAGIVGEVPPLRELMCLPGASPYPSPLL